MNKLLILDSDAAAYLTEISKRELPDIEIFTAEDGQEAQRHAPYINIIFGQPALIAPILGQSKRLQWVQSTFAGVEPLCKSDLPCNYQLTGVKELFGSLMSEYVFGYILARERSILEAARNQQQTILSGAWKTLSSPRIIRLIPSPNR